jgi:hypothetical protein
MNVRRLADLVAAVLLAASLACGGSSSSPAAPSPTPTPTPTPSASLKGVLQDVFTGAPAPGATVKIGTAITATSVADGGFTLVTEPGQYVVRISGDGLFTRVTQVRIPGADATLSMIPSWFPLTTFDQMCRGSGRLKRWTRAPALVLIDAVLEFSTVEAASFVATSERLSDAALNGIVADLTYGLPLTTGDAFTAFQSVTTESPAAGSDVAFFERESAIVVARFKGLQTATRYWGYGRWASRGDAVGAGAVLLDRDFDAVGGPFRRSLRIHEMGHALGWGHVTTGSFMNPSATYEPNDLDRKATLLAYQRPPGNTTPDTDPGSFNANLRASPLVWGRITP